jgi:polyhydroxyalkanoate synthesis regulator phasin
LTRLTSKVSILEKSQQDLRILVDNSETQSGNDLKFLEGKIESVREQTARLVASAVRDINYQNLKKI